MVLYAGHLELARVFIHYHYKALPCAAVGPVRRGLDAMGLDGWERGFAYIYAYIRRWQGSWERGRFEICRSKKSRLSGASRDIGAWATQDGAQLPVNTSIYQSESMFLDISPVYDSCSQLYTFMLSRRRHYAAHA